MSNPVTTYAKEVTNDYLLMVKGEDNLESSLGKREADIKYQEAGEILATAELTKKEASEIREKNNGK